jgi:calcium-dependent protein kinase
MFAVKAFSKETAFGENNGKESIISELKIMRQLKNYHLM